MDDYLNIAAQNAVALCSQKLWTAKLHLALRLAQEQCAEMKRVFKVEQLYPSLISPSVKQSFTFRGVTRITTGLKSNGDLLSAGMSPEHRLIFVANLELHIFVIP